MNFIDEIREHLEKAQNPVFLYDSDADGLCSFILLRRYLGKGKGVVVRSHPDIDVRYAKKVQELNADYVFVLDRPFLGKEFVEEMEALQIPIVWLDHHQSVKEKGLIYRYNFLELGEGEPVTYWAYNIAGRKEDMWIAMMGCIADHFLPGFKKDFAKNYPELWGQVKKPFDAYFKTEIGSLSKSLAFGLKDSITHVVYMQNFLLDCKSPKDMQMELESNSSFGNKYKEMKKKYRSLMQKDMEIQNNYVFFKYSGELSISSEIANELVYLHPKKHVIVAYVKGNISNLSIRGRKAKKILDKILKEFKNSHGGGHEEAVGARISSDELDKFKELFISHI